MKRNIMKISGILGLALVFGLGLAFTSCEGLGGEQTVDIEFTNASNSNITLHIQRSTDGVNAHTRTWNLPPGYSIVPLHDVAGSWRLRIGPNANAPSFRYPVHTNINQFTNLEGNVRFTFDGSAIRRN